MPGEYPISKYRKVIKKAEAAKESEIRVRVNSPPFAYAAYAGKLLLTKNFEFVYLNATGAAVSNSIKVIEYLKRHIKGKPPYSYITRTPSLLQYFEQGVY